MAFRIPAELRQVLAGSRINQTEPAHARHFWTLRHGSTHDHDGSVDFLILGCALQRPLYSELQGEISLQLERRDVAAVVRPLGALVAQEEVENVLPQSFCDELGTFHRAKGLIQAGR